MTALSGSDLYLVRRGSWFSPSISRLRNPPRLRAQPIRRARAMSSQDLDITARLEAHALLDRLTMDGTTFSRDDARRLIALIPVTPRRRFSFTGLFRGRGSGLRGRAA